MKEILIELKPSTYKGLFNMTDDERVIKIETQLEYICEGLKSLTGKVDKQVKELSDTREMILEEINSVTKYSGEELGKKPSWSVFMSIIGLLVAAVVGCYSFTYAKTSNLQDKCETTVNRIEVLDTHYTNLCTSLVEIRSFMLNSTPVMPLADDE